MTNADNNPRTLAEAIRYFSDPNVAVEFVAGLRWPGGPVCPRCGGKDHSYLRTRRLWKCKACKKQFSVKVGTFFESSPVGLDKWIVAIWMIANSRYAVSSYAIQHATGVTQKTAWSMMHRIRLAMQTETFERLSREVETDGGYIESEVRNVRAGKRREKVKGRGSVGEIAVLGLPERR
jgi:transposase-like protein